MRGRFLTRVPDAARQALEQWNGLAAFLESRIDEARQRWPDLDIPADAYCDHLAARLDPEGDAVERLRLTHHVDLYLACGCAMQRGGAAEAFSATIVPQLEPVLRRLCSAAADIDEVRSRVLEKLLVAGDGEAPRIASYDGRGSLLGWARVVASRAGLDWLRAKRPETQLDEAELAADAFERDPELAALKDGYRQEFRRAVRQAIEGLSERQKTLLRYQLVDRLSIDRLAELYRVDRSSAARWLQAVRERIFKRTRSDLMRQLRVDEEEFESIVRLLHSRLDVTLRSLL